MNKLLLVVVLGLVVVLLPFTGTARAGTYKTSALWIGDSYTAGAGVSNPGQYGEGWQAGS